jgi:hypothetical protein
MDREAVQEELCSCEKKSDKVCGHGEGKWVVDGLL